MAVNTGTGNVAAVGRSNRSEQGLRVRNGGNLRGSYIHHLDDTARLATFPGDEHNRIAVRHPARAYRLEFPRRKQARRASISGNHIQVGGMIGIFSEKNDPLSVRRPARHAGVHRHSGGQLQFLGSVNPATPQDAIGISHISQPLSIARKADVANRCTLLVRKKLSGLGIVANQLGAKLVPHSIDLLSVSAQLGAIKAHRPRGQTYWTMVHLIKQITLLPDRPEIHAIRMEDLKDKIVSIRSPASFLVKSPRQLRKDTVRRYRHLRRAPTLKCPPSPHSH